jgi:glycosyltransferase involved in cell wall biosynthesis
MQAEGFLMLPEAGFTAGYTGSLYPGRGVQLILEIAARLPEITFLIVGGDPTSVMILGDEAEQRGLENLYVKSFVPNMDLPRYQFTCDVLLMPYQRRVEASSGGDIASFLSPMKLFEYLACGRVILSSDLPVLREILNDNNAVLLPPRNVDAWVMALQEIKEDRSQREILSAQAREDSKRFTWTARAAAIFSQNFANSGL